MKERLLTIALSVATTWGLLQAGKSPDKVLEVDRLIVRKELIVSIPASPGKRVTKPTRFLAASTPARCTMGREGCGSAAD